MRYFGGCSERSVEQCRPEAEGGRLGRESFAASSRILSNRVDPAAVTALLDGRANLDVLLDSLGGAVSKVAEDATAFPHRRSAGQRTDLRVGNADAAAVAEVRDGLGALTGPHGYVNYIDPAMPDWANAYYGANLPRLRQVAATPRPGRVFAFAQSV